jgi:hypothetical protein
LNQSSRVVARFPGLPYSTTHRLFSRLYSTYACCYTITTLSSLLLSIPPLKSTTDPALSFSLTPEHGLFSSIRACVTFTFTVKIVDPPFHVINHPSRHPSRLSFKLPALLIIKHTPRLKFAPMRSDISDGQHFNQ